MDFLFLGPARITVLAESNVDAVAPTPRSNCAPQPPIKHRRFVFCICGKMRVPILTPVLMRSEKVPSSAIITKTNRKTFPSRQERSAGGLSASLLTARTLRITLHHGGHGKPRGEAAPCQATMLVAGQQRAGCWSALLLTTSCCTVFARQTTVMGSALSSDARACAATTRRMLLERFASDQVTPRHERDLHPAIFVPLCLQHHQMKQRIRRWLCAAPTQVLKWDC